MDDERFAALERRISLIEKEVPRRLEALGERAEATAAQCNTALVEMRSLHRVVKQLLASFENFSKAFRRG